jgi:hypothetical protein
MSGLQEVVRTPAAQALGLALAHSDWQGAAAALALAAVLWLTRSARIRYAAACAALVLMSVLFGATLVRSIPEGPAARKQAILRAGVAGRSGSGPLSRPPESALSAFLPWLAPFWAAGVLAFHLRAVAGWNGVRRLRRTGVCAPPE